MVPLLWACAAPAARTANASIHRHVRSAIGVLRTVSKVGRDTRFILFSDALRVLQKNLDELPQKLNLQQAKALAQPRIEAILIVMFADNFHASQTETLTRKKLAISAKSPFSYNALFG